LHFSIKYKYLKKCCT